MSNPNDGHPRTQRRILAVRVASAALVALAVGGIVAVGPLRTPAADAAAPTSSALTVKWTGDTSAASSFQPVRSSASPHYREFDDIAITVSQTKGIIDQAIRVSVTGFAGTREIDFDGSRLSTAQNFLQAMQCWGSDPLAADFHETCQWGGRYAEHNGVGDTVYSDNLLRVAQRDINAGPPSDDCDVPQASRPADCVDVPFRTVDGQRISGQVHQTGDGEKTYPILNFFNPATTNEVTSARVDSNGTGYFGFETQTADQAPQLGCGTSAHLRCWLVIVPRGTVSGTEADKPGEACAGVFDPDNNYDPYPYGRSNSIQSGSPVNPGCNFWDNRINIPLDFSPVGSTCTVGSAEQRVVGSQLMVGAMSSWQPGLCQSIKTTFSFATNPDSIARDQLLDSGANSPRLAYTGFPISPGELVTAAERDLLAASTLSYAPVAVSGVVVGFIAEGPNGRQEQLTVSPRLMAKLLTQSYMFTVPSNTSDPARNFAHLAEQNRKYGYLNEDPEFRALNPENYSQFSSKPAIVLPGPSGADAIRQVWRWILADDDAVAFLSGKPDPSGMTINPYYLPKGDPGAVVPWWLDDQKHYVPTSVQRTVGLANLDGTPKKLSEEPLDIFPKNDESLVPLQLNTEKSRFDSIQFAPYTENLLSAARQTFRADPNSKTIWDPNKITSNPEPGDWVGSGAQVPGQKFMIAITDSPSAARYGLSVAALRAPNSTVAVTADAIGMTKALAALRPTSLDTVTQVDPAQVPGDGYPLTIVTYAGVNLSKSSAAERTALSSMLTQVTTTGQITGTGIGELPPGYLPLTGELSAQAAASATTVQSYVPPAASTDSTSSNGYAQDDYDDSYVIAADSSSLNGGSSVPQVTAGADPLADDRTAASSVGSLARSGLAISLGVGLAGFLFSPILFRGRGFL